VDVPAIATGFFLLGGPQAEAAKASVVSTF